MQFIILVRVSKICKCQFLEDIVTIISIEPHSFAGIRCVDLCLMVANVIIYCHNFDVVLEYNFPLL